MAKAPTSLITICCVSILALLASIILSESATTPFPRTVRKTVVRRRKLNSSNPLPSSTTEPSFATTIVTPTESSSNQDEFVSIDSTSQFSTSTITVLDTSTQGTPMPSPTHSTNNRSLSTRNSTILTCDDQCDMSSCVRPRDCHTEIVLDHCSCCHVCAAIEGDICYNTSLNKPFYDGMGICGSSLNCLVRNDLEPNERKEAQCHCRDTRVICGSDNVTYSSECKLRQATHFNPNLTIQAWSPCLTAPWIAEIENTTAAVGEEISLSCEVRAFPWPVIHWEFLEESSSQLHKLPGDDPSIVVTIRGGPEQMMTSSWIQIISISPRRQGTYFCIASNSQATVRKQTYVSVYNGNDESGGADGQVQNTNTSSTHV